MESAAMTRAMESGCMTLLCLNAADDRKMCMSPSLCVASQRAGLFRRAFLPADPEPLRRGVSRVQGRAPLRGGVGDGEREEVAEQPELPEDA